MPFVNFELQKSWFGNILKLQLDKKDVLFKHIDVLNNA
jgi:hypothetical protein